MIGIFGTACVPIELIDALTEQGARDLTVVNNNADKWRYRAGSAPDAIPAVGIAMALAIGANYSPVLRESSLY